MKIHPLYDPDTFTITYIISDEESGEALVIDPVLDYNAASAEISHRSLDLVSAHLQSHELKLKYILETHAHADHLSGAQVLKRRHNAQVGIGKKITEVQEVFHPLFNLSSDVPCDGSQFDLLLSEGDQLTLGELTVQVIETPGHTPACVSYLIRDAVFTGDSLFMHDYGVGRCDFPRGSAETLYESVHDKLYHLPDETRVFVGHDYQPKGRELLYETTIGASKRMNPQLRAETTRTEFVEMRERRDQTLNTPKLLYPSLQVNIRAGHLPEEDHQGRRALVIPLHGEL